MNHTPLTFVYALGASLSICACGSDSPSPHDTSTGGSAAAGRSAGGSYNVGGSSLTSSVIAGGTTGTGGSNVAGTAATTGSAGGAQLDSTSNATLRDYYPCQSDVDCPVGLGDCVTTIALSAQENGMNGVPIATVFPQLTSKGICSRVCTNSAAACDELKLVDSRGAPVKFTCQLVYEGASPYPTPQPEFPFDSRVDPSKMAAGVPFGAICRPPFGLDAAVPDEICAGCTTAAQCGDGLCWNFGTGTVAKDVPGSCLSRCTDKCPLGFTCAALPAGGSDTYCVPVKQTCNSCRDLDGDHYGVGHCSLSTSSTPVDCNDADANVFYDPNKMTHAFPKFCGTFDYNCNGLADDAEQTRDKAFGKEHCGACNTPCTGDLFTGAVKTGSAQCVTDNGQIHCAPECVQGYADCDGDPANGCEVAVTNPSNAYYRDNDGDGEGDPARSAFACNGAVPTGYVSNKTDCNDADVEVGATKPEICDGKDNDCNASIDEGFNVGVACDSDDTDLCRNGKFTCSADKQKSECVGEASVNIAESCDGKDNDCNGVIDEAWPELGTPCDGNDSDQCRNGTYSCRADGSGTQCTNEAFLNLAELCNDDDLDEDCDGTVDEGFDVDGDGYYLCAHGGKQPDCDDGDPNRFPGNTELCDGKDNDCDATVDEGFTVNVACDGSDSDLCRNGVTKCSLTGLSTECDEDATTNKSESCNGLDDDCNGTTDEGFDNDGDGFYQCDGGGPNRRNADCCDFDELAKPDQTAFFTSANACGRWDYDCSGTDDKDPGLNRSVDYFCSGLLCDLGGDCRVSTAGFVTAVFDPINAGIPGCGGQGKWVTDCGAYVAGLPTTYSGHFQSMGCH